MSMPVENNWADVPVASLPPSVTVRAQAMQRRGLTLREIADRLPADYPSVVLELYWKAIR